MRYVGVGLKPEIAEAALAKMAEEHAGYYARHPSIAILLGVSLPTGHEVSYPGDLPCPLHRVAVSGWLTDGLSGGGNYLGFGETDDGETVILAEGRRQGIPWRFLGDFRDIPDIFKGVRGIQYVTNAPHWKPWEALNNYNKTWLKISDDYERALRLVRERRESEI